MKPSPKQPLHYFVYLLVFVFAISLANSATAEAFTNNQNPYRVETFSIGSPGELDIRTSGGSIKVTGSENGSVRVEMYVSKNGRSLSKNDTDLSEFDINIRQSGNKITAHARRKTKIRMWDNDNISISFKVFCPTDMSSQLKTSGGSLSAESLSGDQIFKTSGGSIAMDHINGMVEAKTSGGSINLNSFEGTIDAHTSGGSINVSDAEGDLTVNTSGGSINLDKVAGKVEARTSGGSIRAYITNIEGDISLKTSGGGITADIPNGLGLDLDLKGNSVYTDLQNFSGKTDDDYIYGSINGGGPLLTMKTSGGGVRLNYH